MKNSNEIYLILFNFMNDPRIFLLARKLKLSEISNQIFIFTKCTRFNTIY